VEPRSRRHEPLVHGVVDAWNRDDCEAWLDFGHPDIVLHTSGAFPDFDLVYRGRAGLTEFWRNLHEPWDTFQMELESITDVGDDVVVEYVFLGQGPSGAAAEMRFFSAVEVRDGLIARMIIRRTREEAVAALGQEPSRGT
jgi:ketosteroid isomerase-like protein